MSRQSWHRHRRGVGVDGGSSVKTVKVRHDRRMGWRGRETRKLSLLYLRRALVPVFSKCLHHDLLVVALELLHKGLDLDLSLRD